MAPPSRRGSLGSGPIPSHDSHPSSRRSSFASPQGLSSRPHTPSGCPPIPGEGPLTPGSRHHSPGLQHSPRLQYSPGPQHGPGLQHGPSLHHTPTKPYIPSGRPLSDAMLIDSFTAEEKEFYKWFKETEERRRFLLGFVSDPGAYDHFLEDAWPNPKQFEAYENWAEKWLGRHTARMRYRMPDEEFFKQLQTTNSTKDGHLAELCWTLNMCNLPLVILGEANFDGIFACYAVRPSSNFLHPSPPFWSKESDIGSMHESHGIALAINLNVSTNAKGQPAVPVRQVEKRMVTKPGRQVPDSVDINHDDAKSRTNFVFMQLGELCVFSKDWKTARTKSRSAIVGETWHLTGFGVVAELNPGGAAKALWAIYNTQIPAEPLSDVTNRSYDQGGPKAGWIFKQHPAGSNRDPRNKFFAARITDNLRDFGPTKKLEFEIFCRSEVQIVPAMVHEPVPGKKVHVPVQVAADQGNKR
ncbi:hypothetical protein CEP53_003148 [Fusarium sp. AF-6]|nr:hypothetical protein CEP53_003148 [Fusarium sp. AF-6]